ncbi:MAG TPA: hypothetical protein VN025_17735 [Candidatus Dormibacteraeota bacterium]|jgi:hypothetical protein|nr:hypothetical protein [Candidatus Dormibacteraeota bacterium]
MYRVRLDTVEDLLRQSLKPRALRQEYGLPHPLHRFAASGRVKDNIHADVILAFLRDWTFEEPGTEIYKTAEWFLFDSEQGFFLCCSECGIDAEKLRSHLRQFR